MWPYMPIIGLEGEWGLSDKRKSARRKQANDAAGLTAL
jgi:hypothetical protein